MFGRRGLYNFSPKLKYLQYKPLNQIPHFFSRCKYRLQDGRCMCQENESKVIDKSTGKLKCVECFVCHEECTARKHSCENYEPFPEEEATVCVRPSHNQYISFGDLQKCGEKCGRNEFEFQKCHCHNNRRCTCPKGTYYIDNAHNCRLCSKCISKDHPRVGFHQCLKMPVGQVYILFSFFIYISNN